MTEQRRQQEAETAIQAAIVAFDASDNKRANDAINAAIEKLDGTSIAYQQVGNRLIEMGRFAPAATLLEIATTKKDLNWDPMVWAMFAKAKRRGGDTNGARIAEAEATQRAQMILQNVGVQKPDNSRAAAEVLIRMTEAGTYYSEVQHDLPHAVSALGEGVRLFPNSAFTLNALGYTLLDQGDAGQLRRAEDLIVKAQHLEPNAPAIQDSYGWLLYKKRDFEGARRVLRDAIEGDPNIPEIHYHLGMALLALGNKEEAAQEFDRALVLRPTYEAASSAKRGVPSSEKPAVNPAPNKK